MNTIACMKLSNYTTTKLHQHSGMYEIELFIKGSETAVIGGTTYSFNEKEGYSILAKYFSSLLQESPFFGCDYSA